MEDSGTLAFINYSYRKKINFSLTSETKKFEKIKSTFDKNLYKKYANTGYLDSSPIFIVGMPRSGTTLVEQILASHPKVFGADEVEFIPNLLKENFGKDNVGLYFDDVVNRNEDIFKKIGKEYISRMKKISNEVEITTDKLPVNFLSIGFIISKSLFLAPSLQTLHIVIKSLGVSFVSVLISSNFSILTVFLLSFLL